MMLSTIDLGILVLRVLVGLLFVGHGAQKLFGWFGGSGIEGTNKWLESLDFYPAKFWAYAAGLAEFLGGLGLALGLFTPIASALIVGVMLTAILKVHLANGLWVTKNGYEYPLVNLAIASVVGIIGPGKYSLDTLLGVSYPLPMTFVLALGVVVSGVLLALIFSFHRRDEVEFPPA